MKPPAFDYVRVRTWDDAIEAVVNIDGAELLAGGQSLVPMLNLRLAFPSVLVDLQGIDGGDVSWKEDRIVVGALATHQRLENDPKLRNYSMLITESASAIGHPAIRAQGTIGGSLAHGDPSAEWPLALAALDADVVVRGPAGNMRKVAADGFVRHLYTTDLQAGEVIVGVEISVRDRHAGAYEKIARVGGDFALLGVAVALSEDHERQNAIMRLGVSGVAPRPLVWETEVSGTTELVSPSPLDALSWFERHGDLKRIPGISEEQGRKMLRGSIDSAMRRAWERWQTGTSR